MTASISNLRAALPDRPVAAAVPCHPRRRTSTWLSWTVAFAVAAVVPAFGALGDLANRPEVSRQLRALTGEHSRLAWLQELDRKGDLLLQDRDSLLVGFDTDDGRGERLLVDAAGNYAKPLITPRGDRVVFSEIRRGLPRVGGWSPGDPVMVTRTRRVEARIVGWDGSDVRTVAPGYALAVWRDPVTAREWVYVQAGPHGWRETEKNAIYRYPLDGAAAGELVWNQTPVDAILEGTFQLSRDGRRAVGLLPWPISGVIDLEHQRWSRLGGGCWTAMAQDDTYRTWVFDGAHRNLRFSDAAGKRTAKVNITTGEGIPAGEAYHPRWSNHPRYFVVTGPYHPGPGQQLKGGEDAEVRVGKFNDAYTAVASWVTITTNRHGDYFPDLWVQRRDGDEVAASPVEVAARQAPDARWPGDAAHLVFLWEAADQKNEVLDPENGRPRQCRIELIGLARYGRYHVMTFAGGGGSFVGDDDAAMLARRWRQAGALSLEVTLTCDRETERPATLLALAGGAAGTPGRTLAQGGALLWLEQEKDQLTLALARGQRFALGTVAPGQARHVIVTLGRTGLVAGYVDGKRAFAQTIPAELVPTAAVALTGGADAAWSGELDGIALYATELEPGAVARHAELNARRRAGRTTAPRLVLEATLRETTLVPSPASIAPYRRCLVVYRYDVDRVLSGTLDGSGLLVAHWGILDGRKVREDPSPGGRYRLELEPFEQNPQLEGERMDTSPTDLALPLYYDPAPRAADPGNEAKPTPPAGVPPAQGLGR